MNLVLALPWRQTGFECCSRIRIAYMAKIGFVCGDHYLVSQVKQNEEIDSNFNLKRKFDDIQFDTRKCVLAMSKNKPQLVVGLYLNFLSKSKLVLLKSSTYKKEYNCTEISTFPSNKAAAFALIECVII